jgi:hypothetical protein
VAGERFSSQNEKESRTPKIEDGIRLIFLALRSICLTCVSTVLSARAVRRSTDGQLAASLAVVPRLGALGPLRCGWRSRKRTVRNGKSASIS